MDTNRLERISYILLLLLFVFAAALHLGILIITVLFGVFALRKFLFLGKKWAAVVLFLVLLAGLGYGSGIFIRHAYQALPRIYEKALPDMIDYANAHHITLPFSDAETLKTKIKETVNKESKEITIAAREFTRHVILMVIGLVVAISLFSNARLDLDDHPGARRSFYALLCDEIQKRFRAFYLSFELVLGAQLVISCINTVLTSIFLVAVQMPNAWIFVVITFLCGFLPIIGNLISNFLIVGMAFTVSPHLAVAAVVFLVVVHKLEYFLNSKIIGSRIKNPVWLTLLGLVVGERLMGVPGMILAPVVLHYLKVELSRIEMHSGPVKPRQLAEPETELAGGPSDT